MIAKASEGMGSPHSRIIGYLYQFDYLLLVFVLATAIFGLVVLRGATQDVTNLGSVAHRQTMWFGISLVAFLGTLILPYNWYKVFGWIGFVALMGILAVFLVTSQGGSGLLQTVKAGGAHSWIEMSVLGSNMRFQPSEFAKIATVIVIAHWLAWRRKRLGNILETIPPIALMGIPFTIICFQPDFGTAAVLMPVPFILLFVAGLSWRIVLSTVLLGVVTAVGGLYYLTNTDTIPGFSPYQVTRIHVFLEPMQDIFKRPGIEDLLYGNEAQKAKEEEEKAAPRKRSWDSYNIEIAEMALGSGQLWGKGWGKGTLSRLRYLPNHHTDFIYSALGEQFGLAGCLLLLILYMLITWRAVHIAIATPDLFGKYLVVGLLTIFLIHVYGNIGIAVRLLPVTGIPLPMMSYGGTFLVTTFVIFGLIANVGMHAEEARAQIRIQTGRLFY